MWDVVIVGARCAGAVAALRFARAGRSVLVLDKTRRGSDTLSTHVLVPPAIARLERLGLLDEVRASGAPPVHGLVWEMDGAVYPDPITSPHGYILSVRRPVLDPILVRAAEQAGALVRHQTHVDALLWEDGHVVGVRGRGEDDSTFEERARLVVGADGRHSTVARQVQAAEYNVLECECGALYAYYRGVGPSSTGADVLQFAAGPECDSLCCPCDGDVHVVLLIVGREEFGRLLPGGAAAFEQRLRTIPALAPRLVAAERVSRPFPASPREVRGYFRRPFGPGWALVGDAGYYAHPAAANGIADALRSAQLLQRHVERAWKAGEPAETYLDEYQSTRDAENTEAYYFSYRLGSINPLRDPEIAAAIIGR